MRKPVVYISGPISGFAKYWVPFENAEGKLNEAGYAPINPAALADGMSKRQYMSINLASLLSADTVLMLPSYSSSMGALIERDLAKYCGIPVFDDIKSLIDSPEMIIRRLLSCTME